MSKYIHGSKPEEQKRLSILNEIMNSRCIALMEFKGGERLIDIGSGLGQYTLDMARRVGNKGFCLGIERDTRQLEVANQNLSANSDVTWLEFRQGEVEKLPLKDKEINSFDIGHARFIFEHLPKPELAMLELVAAIKPGGRVVVEDDDHASMILHPEPPGFATLWNAYMRSYDRLGNDPYIGRRLVSLLYNAGLRNIRNNVVFFGDCAGSTTFESFVNNLIGVIETARTTMLSCNLIDERTMDEAFLQLRTWSQLPDAAMWYEIYWACGVKP
jgi:ubiquinone/menaquinone biosynthesis C-methylase UbiE